MFNLFVSSEDEDDEDDIDNSEDECVKTRKKEPMFICTRGVLPPIFHSDKVFLPKFSVFWGSCFICQSIGHSQRYCSLKYCTRCGAAGNKNPYGHSVMTCSEIKIWKIRRRRHELNHMMKQLIHEIIETIT